MRHSEQLECFEWASLLGLPLAFPQFQVEILLLAQLGAGSHSISNQPCSRMQGKILSSMSSLYNVSWRGGNMSVRKIIHMLVTTTSRKINFLKIE